MAYRLCSSTTLLVAFALALPGSLAAAAAVETQAPLGPAERAQAASRSAAFRAEDFDPLAYAADRAAYCAQVVPGRIWQLAQPGQGVPVLRPLTPRGQTVAPGESVVLAVQATPGAPVTFLSYGLGAMPNGQTAITVAADESGRAETTFTATAGTVAFADLVAACPTTSGQVGFVVEVAASGDEPGQEGAR